MAIELEIAFRGMESSEAVKAEFDKRIEAMNRRNPDVRRVIAVVEQSHKSQVQGNPFSVSLEVIVPGGQDVYVTHDPGDETTHEDVYVAIRDAFDAAERQLQKRQAKRGH